MAPPVMLISKFPVQGGWITKSLNLREALEGMASIEPVEENVCGIDWKDLPIDDAIFFSDLNISQELLHGINPELDCFLVGICIAMVFPLFPGEIFPALVSDFDSFRKGEGLSTGEAGKQPPATTPRTVELLGNGDSPVIARAM